MFLNSDIKFERPGGGEWGLIPSILFCNTDSFRMKNELAPLSTEVTQRRTELVSIQSDIQVWDMYIYYTVISRYRVYKLFSNIQSDIQVWDIYISIIQLYPSIEYIHYQVISSYRINLLSSDIQV